MEHIKLFDILDTVVYIKCLIQMFISVILLTFFIYLSSSLSLHVYVS